MRHEPVVVVTRRWPVEVEQELRRRYPAVRLSIDDRPLGRDGLRQALEHADAVLPTVADQMPAELFAGDIRTRFIGNFGVGVDHIDTDAARRVGVTVTNTPGVLTGATADLTMTLLLMAARRAGEGERQVRAATWPGWHPTHLLGADVYGKSLGIVGLGRIGSAVARRARFGFDMPVTYYDARTDPDAAADRTGIPDLHRHSSLEELLGTADFVSLHAPGGPGNHHLLDAARLGLMKPGAFLINTARGELVDTAALVEALRSGVIAGAGLDVVEGEPRIPTALTELDNVTLLPHLGSATHEARRAMGMLVLDNLQAFLDGTEIGCRVA